MNHKLTYMCMISLLTNSVVHTVFIPSSYRIYSVFIPYLYCFHTVFIPSYSYLIHTVIFILYFTYTYSLFMHSTYRIKQPYTDLFKDHQSLVRQQIFNNKNNFYILTIFIFFMVSLRI